MKRRTPDAQQNSVFPPGEFREDVVSRSLLIEERRQTRVARRVIALSIAGIVGFVLWAGMTPVHESVTGNGQLLPSERLRKIQHLEGGIVESVLVRAGQQVEAGDVLLRLDGAQVESELQSVEARLASLTLTIDRLRGLIEGEEIPSDGDFAESLRLSQSQAFMGAQFHLQSQLDLIAAERTARQNQLPSIERQRDALSRELELVTELLEAQDTSLQRGLATRAARDEAARAALVLERNLAEIDGMAAQIRADLGSLDAREAEIVSGWRREALDEIAKLEGQREEAAAIAQRLNDRMERLEIVAPVDGTVNIVGVEGPREVIGPGEIVAEIVPNEGDVYARIEIPAERIGGVAPGMGARVRILTYDYTRFGDIAATVDHVSPSSILTEDGAQIFEVRLKLSTDHVGATSEGLVARPGMTVSADIVNGTKTVLSYLLKPIRVLTDRSFREA